MEKYPTTAPDVRFDKLEAAMTEPAVTKAIDMARTYNELMSREETSLEDIAAIVGELDGMWHTLTGQPVKVSGLVSMRTDQGDVEAVFCDDREFVSNGFCTDNPHDGDIVGRRVCLQLLEADKDSEGTYVVCSAEADQVILEFSVASFERASAWLTTFYPDVIDDLDTRICRPSETEAEAVIALKGTVLPPFGEDEEFAHHCIGNYLQSVIQFDGSMPYEITIDGDVLVYDDEGKEVLGQILTDQILMDVDAIVPGTRITHDGISGNLNVTGSLVPENRLDPNVRITVPVDSIANFASLRANFYA